MGLSGLRPSVELRGIEWDATESEMTIFEWFCRCGVDEDGA